ncbi:unnamed protein product [Anisakis simplex]|uniref:Collagen type IV alpha-3-binding protein (inferred by orthology to a human protein) n=1 Tax=Anisakis simplex TaxID=6269 RepID=A0A0M3K248_ANISI|nr:unnamed protein product [Anisakis simplex]
MDDLVADDILFTPSSSLKDAEENRTSIPIFNESRISGILYKWTNYVLGWQPRYFELEDGVLVYYKNKTEKQFGSRGSITIQCALIAKAVLHLNIDGNIQDNEVDLCRFDIATNGVIWYLRAENRNAKNVWLNALNLYATELKERVRKLEDYRDLAARQRKRIEHRINESVMKCESSPNTDTNADQTSEELIRDDGLAFNATTSAIINDINILDKVVLGAISEVNVDECALSSSHFDGSTEAVGNVVSDDEQDWHDARDVSLDMKSDKDCTNKQLTTPSVDNCDDKRSKISPSGILTLPKNHLLSSEIESITMEQLRYAKAGVEEQGVSAREFIHFFFEPKYKMTWDETVEAVNVVESLSDDTVILHQVHKRVWPSAQRESLFWSHVREVSAYKDADACDLFITCNHDCERPDIPLKSTSNVRVGLTIAMVCETVIKEGCNKAKHQLNRNDIYCRVIYVAQVHPGGWVPSAALRVIYKREYPKFLRGFTKYVVKNLKSRQLCI